MKPRIGILLLGHRDYQNDIGLRMACEAEDALRAAGIEAVLTDRAVLEPTEAAGTARDLVKQDVHGIIFFIGTWLEASTAVAAVREVEHLPFALWGFPMFDNEGRRDSTGSLVAYQVVKGALDRMDYRYAAIAGLPDSEEALTRAIDFACSAYAAERLKRSRIGLVGYASMSMYCGTFDHLLLRRYIGPEVEHIDTYTLVRKVESIDDRDARAVVDRLLGVARPSDEVSEDQLLTIGRFETALRQLIEERRLNAINVKCQYELSQEYGMTACVPLSSLSGSEITCGCEGDIPCTVSMLALNLLSGEAVTYADALDVDGHEVLFSSCGFAPFRFASNPDEIALRGFDHPGFRGVLSSFTLRPGRLTFLRIVEGRGEYTFQYGLGEGLPSELRQGRFPALKVRLDGSGESLLESSAGQHYALAYGDLSNRIEMLAGVLGARTLRI